MPTPPPPGFYFFVALFWLVVVCTILMVLFKVAVWWGERYAMSNDETELARRALTRESSSRGDLTGAGTGSHVVVPAQQHQVASELVPDFLMVKDYLTEHTLTDEEAIELLALARRSNGDDLISANKIRDIVGGNEGKVKAHVAAHRKPRPKPRQAARIERPVNGWN